MDITDITDFDPIEKAHELGIRSNHAYIAGFASIALSLGSWVASRVRQQEQQRRSPTVGESLSATGLPPSSRSASRSAAKNNRPGTSQPGKADLWESGR